MTSTLASMRRLSVRSGTSSYDLAVPLGTRLGDLLGSGGFPAGARLVDASGAALADDDLVGEVVQDGALLFVVDDVHTPTLTRVGPTAPPRTGAGPRPVPGAGAAAAGPTGVNPDPARAAATAAQVQLDAAAAGARTRTAARRGRGRPAVPPVGAVAGRPPAPATGAPGDSPGPGEGGRRRRPEPPTDSSPTTGPGGDARPEGRRAAVVPPVVRRAPTTPGTAGTAGALPPPPGPGRSPVPLPPGGASRRGAHAATDSGAEPRAAGRTDVAVRGSSGVALPTPPRVAPPPTGATGRGAVGGGHRAAPDEPERPRAPRGGPAEVTLSPGAYAVPMVLAPVAALLVLLATSGPRLPLWSTWTAGAALLLAGVVACVRPGDGLVPRWGRVAAALSAGCGGFVLATSVEVAPDVAAVCGLVVASAVAMLGRTSAIRRGVFEPWITVTAVATGAVAVDAALAVTLSWPAYVAPLLLAGASPLIMRALPAVALDVPQEQLIDTERLSNTSWSARTGVKRRRRPLRGATVQLITVRASGVVAAGTVAVGLFVTVGYGIAVLSTMPGNVARWSLLAEGVLLLGGIGLASRTVRARFGKRVLRLTAAVVTLETGYHLVHQTGDTADILLVVLLTVVALAVVAGSLALDAGWRSLRLSRIADMAEGFCVVFALPAALLAVDVLAVLRQAAS